MAYGIYIYAEVDDACPIVRWTVFLFRDPIKLHLIAMKESTDSVLSLCLGVQWHKEGRRPPINRQRLLAT